MEDQIRRPRPGFISDADDMMHDMDEMDRRDEGILTTVKRSSIKRFLKRGGAIAEPEFLAENFKVSLEDVHRVIREMAP